MDKYLKIRIWKVGNACVYFHLIVVSLHASSNKEHEKKWKLKYTTTADTKVSNLIRVPSLERTPTESNLYPREKLFIHLFDIPLLCKIYILICFPFFVFPNNLNFY